MKIRFKKATILSLSLIMLYKILLDYVYVEFVYKVFAYSGFESDINWNKYIMGFFYLILIFILIPRDKNKPSSILMQLLFIIMIIPMLTYYAFADESNMFTFLNVLLFAIQCIILKYTPSIKIVRIKSSKEALYVLITLISLLVYFSMIRANGIPSLKALNILNVYEVRKDAVTPFLMGYLVNWQAKIINPFLISIGYIKKDKRLLTISIFMQLLIFLITGHRSFLFIPLGIIVIIIVIRKKSNFFLLSLILANVGVLGSFLSFKLFNEILIPSVFIRRFLFVPARIKYNYYDFFSQNEFIYFSQGLIGKLLGIDYPYDIPRNYFMSYFYGGSITSAANTGYLADGYSQMGFLGMLIMAVLLVCIFLLINSIGSKTSNELVIGLSLFTILSLNDVSLLTTLLTGGLLFLLIILYLYSDFIDTK